MQRPRRRLLTVIVVTQLVLALVTGVGVYLFYRTLDRNMAGGEPIDHLVSGEGQEGPLNILLLGSDERDCRGCGIDRESGGGGADTTILLHVSADRRSAYGVSIPRDALVDRPRCEGQDGQPVPAEQDTMWNRAYSLGGAACTARQLELLTGIHIDHYLTLNFGGFKDMVNAIDGVTVCIPEEIDDEAHNIHLPEGTHELRGQDALNYVRERYSTPNSDIGRMRRQQYFIASMANKVISAGTLARPDRLMRFAVALSESIETDAELSSASGMVDLASQLNGIDLSDIRFITVPNEAFPESSEHWGRLRLLPRSDRLWQRIIDDRPLGRFGSKAISANDAPSSPDESDAGDAPSESTAPEEDDEITDGGGTLTDDEAAENGLC